MKIKIDIRTVYGTKKMYPACERSQLLCDLTGHKTFTSANIDTIKKLGYEIEDASPKHTF
jgi:hypothetical protein